jgi:hypothetical protein
MTDMTDDHIRLWILNDTPLYAEAREFGKGGDKEMYEQLPRFIEAHRERLVKYIQSKHSTLPWLTESGVFSEL